MFRNILVPVDLSDRHHQAVEIATRLAKESDGEVTLLHVIETLPGFDQAEESDFYRRLEQMALDHLMQLGRYVEEHQVHRREEIVYGHRAPEIVRYATETGVDLIVLSSHRIDPTDPAAGWGTVSYKVGILAQCPVLLVK
jgi:nucleotide-binding universal stress UspA family protein